MKLTVTSAALAWFREEWGCQEGDSIRFFVRYGGVSTVQDSFSMGIAKEQPNEAGLSTVVDGITFYGAGRTVVHEWKRLASRLLACYRRSRF